ncbi:MAG: DUF1302 family protein, partial [Opitutaceae bacterium]|nr:DUF1302 family protein [Opitutaceae bacterium]
MNHPCTRSVGVCRRAAHTALGLLLIPTAALAVQFKEGALQGSFDTTISAGGLYRLGSPDADYYGRANGGRQNSVNADDGNLNYGQGWNSALLKASHDLQLSYNNIG